jgi:hypothetical protein
MRSLAPRDLDRRQRHTAFYFPERRTGFDRRRSYQSAWRRHYDASLRRLRDSPTMFPLVLATIVVLNYVDYTLTVRVLRAGGAELNPLMALLFETDPVIAAVAKFGSVGAVVLVLLLLRRYRRTLETSLVLLVGFSALTFYHAVVAIEMLT